MFKFEKPDYKVVEYVENNNFEHIRKFKFLPV